jgi:lipopolysaccharide biosynthesis glycosyltransferase
MLAADTPIQFMRTLPTPSDDAIAVVFSVDDHYAPYLAVTIQSLVHNANPEQPYALYILESGISDESRSLLGLVISAKNNIQIHYIDIESFIGTDSSATFHIPEDSHFSRANYYRFFIPKVFEHFERVIYLDADLIVLRDLAGLYSINPSGKSVAACTDHSMKILARNYEAHRNYLADTLRLENPDTYFNTGVMLCNIPKMLADDFTRRCLECLRQIEKPVFVDQCIINVVLEGDCITMDHRWNFMTNTLLFNKLMILELNYAEYSDLMTSYQSPYIVHYASDAKPWRHQSSKYELAHHWWHYAAMTPFMDRIIQNMQREGGAPTSAPPSPVSQKGHYRTTWITLFGINVITVAQSGDKIKVKLFGLFTILILRTRNMNESTPFD